MPRHVPSFLAGRARQSTETAGPRLGLREAHPLSHPLYPDDRPLDGGSWQQGLRPECKPEL